MVEEQVSGEKAVENVLIMAERLAFLHYAFAKTLEDALPKETAETLIRSAIEKYGQLAAESVMENLKQQGLKPTLKNFKYGKDLPSMGWKFVPMEMPADKPEGKISKITYCPMAEAWKKLGPDGVRLGKRYCQIDQEKYKAYGKGYKCFHDRNTMDGDDCCVIRVELNGQEEREK
ncbi:hypothetical protein EQM14_00395 [Caproiciproducens sp. NJN-50]|uniref:L-2-amino-thiazoline-4-carboxylic acid hydrolase n=1 Tax=Acutalibacteraceae TaxID=3082771 RepID=UPI000FFE13AC|nr:MULTISPECIES: L-2-amino-thiazoline-4-carboxylic acid hydrolase [Acutalibacteraceae]QAT48360.1 hypothetical protein EQM14_00395 [Caproiciproducens sp. NJN-50]